MLNMWVWIAQNSYKNGWYTKETVAGFVNGGFITKDDYKSIVGEPYPEPEEVKPADPATATAEPATATDTPQV
ncbi:MAG: XkdX family protein [Limosilactobacillus sp.]|nr:XkdX family protein [Limosilactobacillus sp.]